MNGSAPPLISVVMPVHNAQAFIDESISSILNQTLTDFEFVILDDASTDGSAEKVREWARKDARIRFHQSTQCLGLSRSSNLVVAKAQAPVVARMDADDISHPKRLELQWNIMQSNPNVVVVGTLCNGIDAAGREVRPRDRWRVVRRSRYIPFPHGSIMFRRETFYEVGCYREEFTGGEDQDLCCRMTTKGKVVTLPDALYRYRYHLNNATLVSGAHDMQQNYTHNGDALAAFYVVGAMRLWAGHPPGTLRPMLSERSLKWNLQSLISLTSAAWGGVSPASLRLFLRGLIRSRDFLAGLSVEEGKPYEWRLE